MAGIISPKAGLQYVESELDAMKVVADAHAKRSLKLLETALRDYKAQLEEDPTVHRHLSSLLVVKLLCSNPFLSLTSPLNSMAITFSDLHTEAGLKSLDEFLSGKAYISEDHLTKDDVKVYAAVLEKPGSHFPNTSKWYSCVSSHLAKSFPGKAVGVSLGCQAAPAEDDDDDLDLFGDETEEEKKAAEERKAAVKASSKKKESGKSSVLLDVKPWDDETDMKKLEEAVRSVEMPGLLWGASKSASVGYGIKKLQIMMTIGDDLVSVDFVIEEHLTAESISEYVQSCDIVAFNKI